MTSGEIERLLPAVIRRTRVTGNPLDGFLAAMEGLLAPAELRLDHLDACFDPWRAPDAFVPLLADWVGLGPLFAAGEGFHVDPAHPWMSEYLGRIRALVAGAAWFAAMRGTRQGLERFLRTLLADDQVAVLERPEEAASVNTPFHIRVLLDARHQAMREIIERAIREEKPAHLTHELVFREEPPRSPT